MTNDKSSRVVLWSGPIFAFLVVTLLIALLLPAVQQAREAARRTQSKNNLKQIGLALHNYHDVFGTFPPGGIFNAEGTAFHGWTTGIAPYLDCSPFYNSINFNYPWDDPQQVEKFITNVHPVFINPSVEPTKSPDGIPLVHYSANQWLFHRNSSTRIKDIETGTSNTLGFADAFGHFAPLGYPYNWRDPLIPINTSPDGFGYNKTGMHALLMDGSVKWINKDMASEIHASFAGPEKLKPTAEQVEKPAGEYRLQGDYLRSEILKADAVYFYEVVAKVNQAGETKRIEYQRIPTKDGRKSLESPLDDTVKLFHNRLSVESIDGNHYLSDAAIPTFADFPHLKSLTIGGKWITDAGAKHLAAMPALRTLTLDRTEMTAEGLSQLSPLPNLSTLKLIEPGFGDEGIGQLVNFPALSNLELTWYLRPVNVSPAKLTELLDRFPGLTIQVRAKGHRYSNDDIRKLVGLEMNWKD